MPLSVLTPVNRRRRPRRFRRPVVLLVIVVAALVAAGAVLAARHFRTHGAAAAPPPKAAVKPRPAPRAPQRRVRRARRPSAPPTLVSIAGPVSRHRFTPALSGAAAILVDANTGRVLWAFHPHQRHEIASTTKIMTAVLALRALKPETIVKISPEAPRAAPNREGLRAGERVKAWKLFYGLLLYSGNDDALALAIASAGSRSAFVDAMNTQARQLGMRNTHFSTPSGVVDRDNHSTAWDMAILARFAMKNPRFRTVVSTPRKEVHWAPPTYAKVYVNKNSLLTGYAGADGIKTGWTTIARHCLVASARRGHVSLIAVVLHSQDAFTDARRVLNLGFRIDR
jgi:serine-type D-Ala-D-Ala carboxypeptidase (penicillin-binding protein 5/6)